jgi:DinB superfamily
MNGRPQSNEAAEYYFTYINLVKDDYVLAVISRQLEDSVKFFSGIPEEKSLHRYAPGKWSIRECLNHVTDAERVFAIRAWWFARGLQNPLPGFDQDIAAGNSGADNISWAAHIEEFQRVRLSTISLFANMPPEGWSRKGIASDKPFTVRALAFITAGHLAHHENVLRERYL